MQGLTLPLTYFLSKVLDGGPAKIYTPEIEADTLVVWSYVHHQNNLRGLKNMQKNKNLKIYVRK